MLGYLSNIFFGIHPSQASGNLQNHSMNHTDQKVRLIVKMMIWGAIGTAVTCMTSIPAYIKKGESGWFMTVSSGNVILYEKFIPIPLVVFILIGASVGTSLAYYRWSQNRDAGVFKW